MRKKIILLAIVASLFNTSCIATRSTTQISKAEVGMSKADIKKLLGTPEFKNGDTEGLQKLVNNVAKQKGISIDDLRKNMGI